MGRNEYVIRCESVYAGREGSGHPGKWIIQVYHRTGMPMTDALCPHYWARANALADMERSRKRR